MLILLLGVKSTCRVGSGLGFRVHVAVPGLGLLKASESDFWPVYLQGSVSLASEALAGQYLYQQDATESSQLNLGSTSMAAEAPKLPEGGLCREVLRE